MGYSVPHLPTERELVARLLCGRVSFSTVKGRRHSPWDATKRPLWNTCKTAKLRQVGWHTLRHTFCSHLAMKGAPPVAIQVLAGHESPETTKRYQHLAPVTLRETIKLLEGEARELYEAYMAPAISDSQKLRNFL
jgi:integrase